MFRLRKKHHGDIRALAISPDGGRCVTGANSSPFPDIDARIWALPELTLVTKLKGHAAGVGSAAWSPDGRQIATAGGVAYKGWPTQRRISDHAIRLWEAESGRETGQLGWELQFVNSLAFSADSRLLLTGSSLGMGRDKFLVRLWDIQSGRELSRFGMHHTDVESVTFSPDGTMIASGSAQPLKQEHLPAMGFASGPTIVHSPAKVATVPTLRLFDVASGREIDRFEYFQPVNSVRFSPNGAYLLTVGNEYLMWEVSTGRPVFQFRSEGSGWAGSIDISNDGRYVAIACGDRIEIGRYSDCCVRLWRLDTPREVAIYPHKRPVHRVAFIPNRELLVAVGDLGEIRLWLVCASVD